MKNSASHKLEDFYHTDDVNLERVMNKSSFSEIKEVLRRRKQAEKVLYISEIDKDPYKF